MTAVSVLVPCYNHADYVVAAVRSALEAIDAAGVSAEVRVLDDGSSDGSLERLARIDDDRLQVETQENAGAHAAFNRLLASARGDYVFLLNSDDLFTPDRIAKVLARFESEPDLVAAGSWLEIIDTEDKQLGVKQAWLTLPPWPKPRRGPCLSELGDPGLALLETNYLSTTSNIAFRRELAADLRFADLRYCHDWDFFLGLAARGKLALIDEPLVRYRVHPSNTLRETEREGTARMRFEIQWLLARRAAAVLEAAVGRGHDAADLRRRLWSSLPHFGAEKILLQLFAWAGAGEEAGGGDFESLLDRDHPWRMEAEAVLRKSA